MRDSRQRTTIAAYGLAIWKALESNGHDARRLFKEAGIGELAGHDPTVRLTTTQVATLYRHAVAVTRDPAFGLVVARFMHPSSLHALGYSLLASSTLRDCANRLVRYLRIATEQIEMRISEADGAFCLSTHLLADGVALETTDAWHAFLVKLFRQIHSPELRPVRVALQRPEIPGYAERFEQSFRVPVSFDAPFTCICLSLDCVDQALMGANREIAQQNDQIIDSYLATLDKNDIVSRVRKLMVQNLSAGRCSKRVVADALHMSASSLTQHLAKDGTTFQDLMNSVRESLALAYLEQGRLSITEISFMLGFSDTSSFTRAFHRWTGQSPTGYRTSSVRQ